MQEWPANSNDRVAVRVWDPLVRLFHWTVVAGVVVAFVTDDWRIVHKFTGYVVFAAVLIRILWGFLGTRHARFSEFVSGPRTVIGYVRDLWHGRKRRYLGHNPLGGVMVVVLLVTLLGICVSGWMLTFDAFWGDERLEMLHELAANLLVFGLVPLHLAGVLFMSLRERVNLVWAMITGVKHLPAEDSAAQLPVAGHARWMGP